MQPYDQLIVRFSFACLALSLVAGLLPVAFPDSLWQDLAAERIPEEPVFVAADQSVGVDEQAPEACSVGSLICDIPH